MKNLKLTYLLTALLVVFISACDKEENGAQQQLELPSVGFTGTLPGNLTFGDKNITSRNHIAGVSSQNEGALVTHYITISDTVARIGIQIILPHIKYSDDFKQTDIITGAQVYYPFQRVKSMLAPGNKPILSQQEPDIKKGFQIFITGKSFDPYSADIPYDQAGSQLKVTQVIEGTETDPIRGQVKTLHITFEVDVKLYPNNNNYNRPERFKGLLRMKYRNIE